MRYQYFFRQILFFICLTCSFQIAAQPFYNDIQEFKKQDSVVFPPKNAILFVGSSSFTNWRDVQAYFPAHTIINRGFGGSSFPDVIRYSKDIIFPYQPKQIVIYCGENDLAASDTVTAKMVYQRFINLFKLIRRELPDAQLTFISLKPSPSRWHLKDKMKAANKKIKKFLGRRQKTYFVNVFDNMLGADGKPMPEIFLDDQLHMNVKGYAIWQKLIEPALIK